MLTHASPAPARGIATLIAVVCLSSCDRAITSPASPVPIARQSHTVGGPQAVIYWGNGSRYGNATSTGVLGYTHLAATWTAAGASTTITNVWPIDVASVDVLLLAEPRIALTAAQVADIQALLAAGGTLIINDESDNPVVDNALLTALGSGMALGDFSGFLTLTSTITGLTPYSDGIPTGNSPFCLFNPGRVTGGINIVEHPVGRPVVATRKLGGGTIIVSADADVFLNVAYLWFQWTPACIANHRQFHHNIIVPHLDETAPIIEPVVTGTPGASGWYVSDVSIDWSVSDPESGIASEEGCAPSSVLMDTDGQTFTCSAVNGAGLSASQSVLIKRDATPPRVIYEGNAGIYTVSQSIGITCTAVDDMSGVATHTCADVMGPAYSFAPGAHVANASAIDLAGNTGSGSTSFEIVVTSTSLCELTRAFVGHAGVATSLCAKLEAAARSRQRGDSVAAAGQLGAYEREVNAQSGKAITAQQAGVLLTLVRLL